MADTFLIVAGLLGLLVLALVMRPLWRRDEGRSPGPGVVSGDEAARLAVYRDRREEIEREREAGRLSAAEAERQQQELVEEVAQEFGEAAAPLRTGPNRWLPAVLALAGVATAAAIYLKVGAPGLVDRADMEAQWRESQDPKALVARLEARVKAEPGDAEAWSVLGAAYKFSGDLPKAIAAFEKSFQVSPPKDRSSARALAEYAEALALQQDSQFAGKPTAVLEQALKLDPDEPKALAMMGAAQYRAGNLPQARQHIGRLVALMPPGSREVAQLQPVLDRIDAQLRGEPVTEARQGAPAAPLIKGRVDLSAAARGGEALKEARTLFISVRSAAPGAAPMPLAALRIDLPPGGSWPMDFAIGNAQAMNQQLDLAKAGPLLIEAHLSRSGQPGKKPGDWFARLSGIEAGKAPALALQLSIDQQQP